MINIINWNSLHNLDLVEFLYSFIGIYSLTWKNWINPSKYFAVSQYQYHRNISLQKYFSQVLRGLRPSDQDGWEGAAEADQRADQHHRLQEGQV